MRSLSSSGLLSSTSERSVKILKLLGHILLLAPIQIQNENTLPSYLNIPLPIFSANLILYHSYQLTLSQLLLCYLDHMTLANIILLNTDVSLANRMNNYSLLPHFFYSSYYSAMNTFSIYSSSKNCPNVWTLCINVLIS